jgi:Leucine-rich repeat (LRR) protein
LFEELPYLKTIYLNNNQLSTIETLGTIGGLTYLDVSYNSISNIDAITQLGNIEHFDASHNSIDMIKDTANRVKA